MSILDSLKKSQQELTKSRWLNLLLPMGGIGLILFVITALLMNLSYHSLNALAEQEVEERMLESASQMALQLADELLQIERHAGLLASQTPKVLKDSSINSPSEALKLMLKSVYETHDLISLAYIDILDSVRVTYPKASQQDVFFSPMRIEELDNRASVSQHKNTWISRYSKPTDKSKVFSLLHPVAENNKVTALVGLEISLDSLGRYLTRTPVPWSGYTLLMNPEGELSVFPYQEVDASKAIEDKNLLGLEPLRLDASGLIALSLNNQKVLLSWASVTPTGWKLINIATEKRVFAVKNQLINDYRLVLLLGGFFIVAMFFILVFLVKRRDQLLAQTSQLPIIKEESVEPSVSSSDLNPSEFMELVTGPIMACQFDADGLIVACNSAFEHLAGSTLSSFKNKDLMTLLGLQSLKINQGINEVELRVGQQEVTSFWISVHHSASGAGLLLLLDISEYKQIQKQLSGERKRARLASKMKAEFFQVAVSDANTLLIDLLNNARGFDATLTSYCQSKLMELQHLLDDIRDMSDAGETDQPALAEETLVLSSLIDDCYTASQSLLVNSGRRLLIEYGAGIPENLVLDRRRLFRLMRHLLRQMIQLSTKGDIYFWLGWSELGRLQLRINDQGGGLQESERLRRFQLTTPLSSSYESASGALGLGQLLTRQLIHEMRGSLEVEALTRGGLQLKIEIPAKLVVTNQQLSLGRILVVDDGPVNAMLASSVLEKTGYQVDVANSGSEALALGLQQDYDLVLMDIFMPSMDGLETTRQWRKQQGPNAQVPIIALTANAMKEEREHFLQQGLDGYLAKPYRPNELRELVQLWLQK